MRILQVNKFLYRRGGAESYMLGLAERQRDRGDTVEFFGMDHPDNEPAQSLQGTFPPHVELEPAPRGAQRLTSAARMIWSLAGQRGMAAALRDLRPDVVHCHNIYHQLSPSILFPVHRAGIPCVMTLHDYKLACPNYQLLDHGSICEACVGGGTWHATARRCKDGSLTASALLSLESGVHRLARAYDKVDLFISPSHFLADVMRRAGVADDRLRVVPNYADLQQFQPAPVGGTELLFVGRLSHEKGVDVLVDAVGMMPEGTRLSIAGDGPQRAALAQRADRVAPGRVTFHGRVDGGRVRELLASAAVSVVPSRWHENQPMTILESFAMSVPVVVTNLGGMPELVRDGAEGLVVPPDDATALAGALSRLLEDPEKRRLMGEQARARVVAEFGIDRHLARIDEVYAEATARVRARRAVGGRR